MGARALGLIFARQRKECGAFFKGVTTRQNAKLMRRKKRKSIDVCYPEMSIFKKGPEYD